jgi:hypothetical protein
MKPERGYGNMGDGMMREDARFVEERRWMGERVGCMSSASNYLR